MKKRTLSNSAYDNQDLLSAEIKRHSLSGIDLGHGDMVFQVYILSYKKKKHGNQDIVDK